MTKALLSFALLCSFVVAEELPRTITVSGVGKAGSPPDMATINSGVVSVSKTAQQALKTNTQLMEQLLQILKTKNVADKDVQTAGFSVYPEYFRDPSPRGTTKANQISGYRVSNNVSVKVRDLKRLGEILDALVQGGSNQISGVQFSIAKADEVTNDARKNAIGDARARAELYAAATGVQVGKVISISEQAIQSPRPMPHMRMAMAEMSSSVPIASGEQEVTATVNVMYELVD